MAGTENGDGKVCIVEVTQVGDTKWQLLQPINSQVLPATAVEEKYLKLGHGDLRQPDAFLCALKSNGDKFNKNSRCCCRPSLDKGSDMPAAPPLATAEREPEPKAAPPPPSVAESAARNHNKTHAQSQADPRDLRVGGTKVWNC